MTPASLADAASDAGAAPASAQATPAATAAGRIPLWVDLRHVPRHKRLGYLGAARTAHAEAVLLASGDEHMAKDGVAAVAVDAAGALRRGRTRLGRIVAVTDAASQRSAGQAKGLVVVQAPDWRIIPLENLIAARRDRPGTLYAHAASPRQALLFAQTLQTGVHGIVLAPQHPSEIGEADRLLRDAFQARPAALPDSLQAQVPPGPAPKPASPAQSPTAPLSTQPSKLAEPTPRLVPVPLTRIEDAGLGDRVCIDCTSAFAPGEGLLVGSTARGFLLVHAETIASDLVATRPFRVNAGALHSYLLGPDGRTMYLSEVTAGTRVMAATPDGTRTLTVGRAKIEPRPHLLIAWDGGSAVLQNAETVRILTPGGPVSVTALRVGDHVLVHAEAAARHTGLPIDAAVEER